MANKDGIVPDRVNEQVVPPTAEVLKPETPTRRRRGQPLLVEVAWEAVNQVGGIYTVIRSKLAAISEEWSSRYCVVGPYFQHTAAVEFEETKPTGSFGQAVKLMQDEGLDVKYGYWLVTGRPRAVLVNIESVKGRLGEIKHRLFEHHGIPLPLQDDLVDNVVAFGYMVERFFAALCKLQGKKRDIIGHFHEWMAGTPIPEIRRNNLQMTTVFTTHATMLGRYLAANDPQYYNNLDKYDWAAEAKHYNIEPQVNIERAASHGSHVFCTVSDVTARECEHLLHRKPDKVTPNGLNIERFVVLHEFQNMHRRFKEKIHHFTIGHFFPNYSFDLDKTLYVFTSGRFEYRNKGFDMTIESLAKLNWRLKEANSDRTVVAFIVTRAPYKSINPQVIESRAMLEEMRRTCEQITDQLSDSLFYATAAGKEPKFDNLVDEYLRLRLKRTHHAWKSGQWPSIVTHDLYDDSKDPILNQLRSCNLLNNADDRVKVVYHPDFITAANPLWGMDYDDFVRGCHVGIFPSSYEPWGYTPLECMARGLPSITTDLSGFGSYVKENIPKPENLGIYVIPRSEQSFDQSAEQIAGQLYHLLTLNRRDRIALRNDVESSSEKFDWMELVSHYNEAYDMAVDRVH